MSVFSISFLGEKTIGPNSCIPVILNLLKPETVREKEVNVTKLESGFRFLHALWSGRKDSHKYFKVLRILRSRTQFWSSVFYPLYLKFEPHESEGILTVAHALSIIAHEYYFATKMNEEYEKKLNQLILHENTVIGWSDMVKCSIAKLCDIDDDDIETESEIRKITAGLITLVESWHCFWSVLVQGQELQNKQKLAFVINGIVSCVTLVERLTMENSSQIRKLLQLASSTTFSNLSRQAKNFSVEDKGSMLANLYKGKIYQIINS